MKLIVCKIAMTTVALLVSFTAGRAEAQLPPWFPVVYEELNDFAEDIGRNWTVSHGPHVGADGSVTVTYKNTHEVFGLTYTTWLEINGNVLRDKKPRVEWRGSRYPRAFDPLKVELMIFGFWNTARVAATANQTSQGSNEPSPSGHDTAERSGYGEFRHRVDMVYDRSIGGPANMRNVRTPEARCIRYLMHHCAYHRGDLAGYANLRSRLDDSKEDIRRDLRGRPGAAAHWLLFLVDHCVNNFPTPEGYQELHRRLSQECWPQAEGQLKGERRVESDWVAYLIWHIVGNPATL